MNGCSTPAPARYRRRTAPPAALRELLEATLSWTEPSGPARAAVVDGVRYRLTPLTAGAGGAAVLCEAPHRSPIPVYELRRRIRVRFAAECRFNLVIFTDAAHSELVWSWCASGPAGERVYRELAFRPGEAWGPLRPVLESIAAAPPDDGPGAAAYPNPCVTHPDPAVGLLAALAHRIDAEWRSGAPSREWAQAVQDAISAAAGADGVRACWRALLQSRVHDPDCGDGERLEMALRALVPAYEACLQRMDIELADLRRHRPPPRRDRLSDFARLTARAGGTRDGATRRLFGTELALLHNLSGVARSAELVDACRSRLISHLATPGCMVEAGLLSLRIVPSDAPGGCVAADEGDGSGAGATDHRGSDDPLTAEVLIVKRAVATILRMHLSGAVALDELSRAMSSAAGRLKSAGATLLESDEGDGTTLGALSMSGGCRGLRLTRGSC